MVTYEELLTISPLAISINAVSTAADVFIAATLVSLLQRSRTGFRRSDTMITRLIIFVVNTGVLTSICAIGSLVSLIVSPKTLIYAAFYYCLGRLYTNSLIATLNARKGVIQAIEERTDNKFYSFQTLTNVSPHKSRVDQQQQQQTNNIAIRIDTTKEARVETSDEKSMALGHSELETDIVEDADSDTIAPPKTRML